MKISDILKEDQVTLTYEVFPPRAGDSYESVAEKARAIAELRPAFMSVTYGAGGGRSAYTVELASDISRRFGVESLAHLTCVSSTHDMVRDSLERMKQAGLENVRDVDIKELRERLERIEALEREIKERERAVKAREGAKKQLVLRLAPSLWDEIAAWAEEDFRSINSQIEYLLTRAVKERKGK